MAIRDLKDQIGRLPEQPGVYLYFNAAGETVYVGRARVLRDRVRSYLGAYGSSPKTAALLDDVTHGVQEPVEGHVPGFSSPRAAGQDGS